MNFQTVGNNRTAMLCFAGIMPRRFDKQTANLPPNSCIEFKKRVYYRFKREKKISFFWIKKTIVCN